MKDQRDLARRDAIDSLCDWLVICGVQGTPIERVIETCSRRLRDAGLRIVRMHTTVRSLHPRFGAVAHRWHHQRGSEREAFPHLSDAPTQWWQSPLYHMLQDNLGEFRQKLAPGPALDRFPVLKKLHDEGGTDYFAARLVFADPRSVRHFSLNSPPEGMFATWLTDAPEGFAEQDIADLRRILPVLGLALKSGSDRRMAKDLLDVYLGPDAGRRVMSGDIRRGSVETLPAAILYFDLNGFTRLSERLSGQAIVDMLNDYFEGLDEVVRAHMGNILKFMGDGAMAVFSFGTAEQNCRAALDAAARLRAEMDAISRRRRKARQPVAGFSLGLHAGDVLYGNIGAESRLDFTVIGSAVNAAARVLDMCAHLDQSIVISAAVARCALDQRNDLVSLGTYRLRSVSERQELFTLD